MTPMPRSTVAGWSSPRSSPTCRITTATRTRGWSPTTRCRNCTSAPPTSTVVYYPDIGMTPQSILLANLRLAPIQIMSLGHPVSTWGSEIDYFISGADVEPPNYPERNYSERLVLLPGCGGVYNRPLYERR